MAKKDTELDKLYRELNEMKGSGGSGGDNAKDLRNFFLGLLMLGGGLFMIFQNIIVSSSWSSAGHFFHIGSFNLPNGLIMLPIVAGIFMLFMMEKRIFGWIVTVLGIIFILLTILMNVRLVWRTTSAYVFVLMFGLTAAGGGLLVKSLFGK